MSYHKPVTNCMYLLRRVSPPSWYMALYLARTGGYSGLVQRWYKRRHNSATAASIIIYQTNEKPPAWRSDGVSEMERRLASQTPPPVLYHYALHAATVYTVFFKSDRTIIRKCHCLGGVALYICIHAGITKHAVAPNITLFNSSY